MYDLKAISGNLGGGVVEITDAGGGTRHLGLFPAESIHDLAMVDGIRGVACGRKGGLALFDCRSLAVEARAQVVGESRLAVLPKTGLIAVQGYSRLAFFDARTLAAKARYGARQRIEGSSWRLLAEGDPAYDPRRISDYRKGAGDIRTLEFGGRLVERADRLLVAPWSRAESVAETKDARYERIVGVVFLDLAAGTLTEAAIGSHYESGGSTDTHDILAISPDGRRAVRRSPTLPRSTGEPAPKASPLGRLPGFGRRASEAQAGSDARLVPALEIWRLDLPPVLETLVEPTAVAVADLSPAPANEREAPRLYWTGDEVRKVSDGDLHALAQPLLKPLVERLDWSDDAFDAAFRRAVPGSFANDRARWTLWNLLRVPAIFFDLCRLASAQGGDVLVRPKGDDDALAGRWEALRDIRTAAEKIALENLSVAWTADSRSFWVLQASGGLRRIWLDGRLGLIVAAEPIAGRERMRRWKGHLAPTLTHRPDGSIESDR